MRKKQSKQRIIKTQCKHNQKNQIPNKTKKE